MIHIRAIDPIKTMRRVVVVLLCLMLLAAVTNCTTDQLNIYRALTGMELLDDPPPPAAAPGEPELEVDPLIDPVDPVDPGGTHKQSPRLSLALSQNHTAPSWSVV